MASYTVGLSAAVMKNSSPPVRQTCAGYVASGYAAWQLIRRLKLHNWSVERTIKSDFRDAATEQDFAQALTYYQTHRRDVDEKIERVERG